MYAASRKEEVKHVHVDDFWKKKIIEIQSELWITVGKHYPPDCISTIFRIITVKLGPISPRLTHKKDGQAKYF
jgi:hypothetical protein